MFAWSEWLVILIIAVIFIRPKDMPQALLTLGRWVRKARLLFQELTLGLDRLMLQAELKELHEKAKDNPNLNHDIEKLINPSENKDNTSY